MYESRAYDNEHGNPVVVLVTTGTHDVSRLVQLLQGRLALTEHMGVADRILRQVKRHNGGRAALALLKAHGGPDFTEPDAEPPTHWVHPASGVRYDLTHAWLDGDGDRWEYTAWLHATDGNRTPLMRLAELADAQMPPMVWRRMLDVIEQYGPVRPVLEAGAQKAGA